MKREQLVPPGGLLAAFEHQGSTSLRPGSDCKLRHIRWLRLGGAARLLRGVPVSREDQGWQESVLHHHTR